VNIRTAILVPLIALSFAACNDKKSPVQPTNEVPPKFQAVLLPANETTKVTNAEASGSGTATIVFNLTKDAAGTVTAATVDFSAQMTGFPNGTALTAAHIHPGNSGVAGPVLVSTNITPGEITMPAGSGTLTKNGQPITVDQVNQILANPQGFYFNIHTASNPGGVARGQLLRVE
jgi:hypothetical protein